MKSIVNQKEKVEEKEFPKLMIHKDGTIILFTSINIGTLLYNGGIPKSPYTVGIFKRDWIMYDFRDFNGTVTLSND